MKDLKDMATAKSGALEQLNSITSLKDFPPAVLVLCPDRIRRDRIRDILLRTIYQAEKDTPIESLPQPEKISAQGLSKQEWKVKKESLLEYSLFASSSVFIIEDSEKLTAETSREIAGTIPTIPSQTKLLILASSLTATNAIYKLLSSNKWLIELEELKGDGFKRWLQKELKSAGFLQAEAICLDNANLHFDRPRSKVDGSALGALRVRCNNTQKKNH